MEWFNDNAGAIQGISTVLLVAVTIYYARSTRHIATETRDMAIATEKLSELTAQQQLDGTRPVIGFRFANDYPTAFSFSVWVLNTGVGPALDLRVGLFDSPFRTTTSGPVLPTLIPVGETITVGFSVQDLHPFTDAALLDWPRNEDDEAAEALAKASIRGGSAEIAEQRRRDQELAQRHQEFSKEARAIAQTLTTAGTLRATYRDIHGRAFTSEVDIGFVEETLEDQERSSLNIPWKKMTLGPVRLSNEWGS